MDHQALTLNFGLRYDYFNGSVPAQDEAELLARFGLYDPTFVPVRSYPEVKDVPNWKDVNPRMAGVYDLFGNGRTAVKASLGRYVAGQTATTATNLNPINTSVNSATRTWNDCNRDFVVDCDFVEPAAERRVPGALEPEFRSGQSQRHALRRRCHPRLRKARLQLGGVAGIQHELRDGVSVTASYYRRWFGNFSVTQNTATAPTDYTSYCITAPVDPRLPGGGGNQICGFYDVNPNKFGQVLSLVSQSSDFGAQESVWDGYGLTTSVRLPKGAPCRAGWTRAACGPTTATR